ncbi:MAG TPA: HEAT repeat domain-containing protein [Thermoanaerobaculia bacterium]|nr:HEAT repeat domain-containing protein [Thermoanaerobaculia bacterium]
MLALVLLSLFFANSDQTKMVERLTKQLKSHDVHERIEAARLLWDVAAIAKPAAIPALRDALNDSEPSVVVHAAGALIAMDVPERELADPLRRVLHDGDQSDRFLAARALIGIDPVDQLTPPILDYLRREAPKGKNYGIARKAVRKLASTHDRAIIAPLLSELTKSPQSAQPILEALGDFNPPPPNWIETLIGQLEHSDPHVRSTAVDLLGKQKARAGDVKMWAVPVSRLCTDPDASVRMQAVFALQYAGGLALEGLPGVLQALASDSDADVRARAAEAAGEMANAQFAIDTPLKVAAAKNALPVLTAAADKDASHEVRRNAVRAINQLQLDNAVVVPLLAQIAVEQKDTQDVRWAALLALRNRGKDAASAADAIRPLASDADADVRKDAQAALDSFKSEYRGGSKAVVQLRTGDPDAREHALAYLREHKLELSEDSLFRALTQSDVEQVKNLLDAGISPNVRFANSFGDPALRAAIGPQCEADAKTIVRMLLARGADPKLADDRGNTALMEAAQKCDAETVKMLLKAGADMSAKNKQGVTAFEFGMWDATEGAAALVAAGYRLPAEKAKQYREAYKGNAKVLALLDKASAPKK